jgi:hypothetical protein
MDRTVFGLCLMAALLAPPAWAQGSSTAPDVSPIEVDLRIGGTRYEGSRSGECKHAPRAGIYGVQAAMWQVSHSAGERRFRMTLWQPRSGPEMVQLQVSTGGKPQSVDTVTGGTKKDTKGSAQVKLERNGDGGIFHIEATSAEGEKIRGTVRCGRFGGIRAEGG